MHPLFLYTYVKFQFLYRFTDSYTDLINFVRPCGHNSRMLQCATLLDEELRTVRRLFYNIKGKIQQDTYLCQLLVVSAPQRRRIRIGTKPGRGKSRNISISYYLRVENHDNINVYAVCQQFFLSVFGLTKGRIATLAKFVQNGDIPKERRGGDRVSHKNMDKKNKVREFLNNVPDLEILYKRNRNKRIHVSSYYVTISELFKFYNESVTVDQKVSLSMFTRIFKNEYNMTPTVLHMISDRTDKPLL